MRSTPGTVVGFGGAPAHRGATDVWLLAIVAMLLVVGGLGFWSWQLHERLEAIKTADIPRAAKDLTELLAVRKEIIAIRKNSPVGSKKSTEEASVIKLLQDETERVGLKNNVPNLQPQKEVPIKGGFIEHAYKIQIKDATREQIAHLIYNVEIQSPYMRAKTIDLKFDEFHKIKDTNLELVFYTH